MRHILIVVTTLVLVLSARLYAAGLDSAVKSAFDDAYVSSSGAMKFETQSRGYYTFGSARMRWANGGSATVAPFSVNAPSISIGCNGIDINLGGISYINGSELRDKMKAMMSQSAGFFFKAALSTLCKDCAAILDKLEDFANAINSLNFDSCAAAKGIGEYYGRAFGTAIKSGMSGTQAQKKLDSMSDGLLAGLDGATSFLQNLDLTKMFVCAGTLGDCGAGVKYAATNRQGSLIRIAISTQTMKEVVPATAAAHEEFAAVMRGLLGDIYGYTTWLDSSGKTTKASYTDFLAVAPSSSSDEDFINALIYGSDNCVEASASSGSSSDSNATKPIKCPAAIIYVPSHDYNKTNPSPLPMVYTTSRIILKKGFYGYAFERLDAIIKKTDKGEALTPADQTFLGNLPYPIIKAINARKAGIFDDNDMGVIVAYLAANLARTAAVDLLDRTHRAIDETASLWLPPREKDSQESSERNARMAQLNDFKGRVSARSREVFKGFDKPISEARIALDEVIKKAEQQEKIEKMLRKQFFVGSYTQSAEF
jgi:conjugative transfer pilus assembly protein TraH